MRFALMMTLLPALLLAGAGCGHGGGAAPPPTPPAQPLQPPSAAELPPPDTIPGTFTVRQKVTAHSSHGGGSFEAVLQKQPGKLVLVGLTPYGARAFLLEQTPGDLKFTSYLQRELPFAPAFVLLDVHRVFGEWLGPPLPEGDRAGPARGELVRERWHAGTLVERTFSPPGEPGRPTTVINYVGQGPSGLAARAALSNERLGYSLVIETLPL